MRPKSLKLAQPFSRYSTLKTEIWTILREKNTEKPIMLFYRNFEFNEITPDIQIEKINKFQFFIDNVSGMP